MMKLLLSIFKLTTISILTLLNFACVAPGRFQEISDRHIFLVRHAEKQVDGTRDPSLTKAGQQRAKNLIPILNDKNISSVYSTDYKRTIQTAKPLADEIGTNVKIYDPDKLNQFAKEIMSLNESILVVGHSNTTPALVELLGGESLGKMTESEYSLIYLLKVSENKVTTQRLYSSADSTTTQD